MEGEWNLGFSPCFCSRDERGCLIFLPPFRLEKKVRVRQTEERRRRRKRKAKNERQTHVRIMKDKACKKYGLGNLDIFSQDIHPSASHDQIQGTRPLHLPRSRLCPASCGQDQQEPSRPPAQMCLNRMLGFIPRWDRHRHSPRLIPSYQRASIRFMVFLH